MHRFLSLNILLLIATVAPAADQNNTPATPKPGLAGLYADSFRIGVALNKSEIAGTDLTAAALIRENFNSLTAENDMKWERIEPVEGKFEFAVPDAFVALGEKMHAFMIGHTLLWHEQTPAWVFQDAEGKPASREILLHRLRAHIDAVVGRYRGRIQAWDVVNEALNDDGTLRNSPWRRIIGDDYIVKAFEFAHAADPLAKLYYNDYNLHEPAKLAGAVKLVRSLQAKGIALAAVGIQGHFGLGFPPLDDLETSIVTLGGLGVHVMFTELDVSVLPMPSKADWGADISKKYALQAEFDPYTHGLPPDIDQKLADHYAVLFRQFLKHRDIVDRVTFWNLSDASTWRNNWPMQGRTDYPVLFDRQNKPKKAYEALLELKKNFDAAR